MSVNNPQDYPTLLAYLQAEYAHPFSGWDFSYLNGRWSEDLSTLPWNYRVAVESRLPHIHSLLDMGTGGGEQLASFHPLPADTCATEGYPPNVPVARQRLEPLGVQVYELTNHPQLPLEDQRFDLVINRHEAYSPQEVLRVLKPGGTFLTQQVDGATFYDDFNHLLGAPAGQNWPHWTLPYAANELVEAGFTIEEQAEARPVVHFNDIGAIVYYLKAIPWQINDFSVEGYLPRLEQIHRQIQRDGFIEVHGHYFFIVARKG